MARVLYGALTLVATLSMLVILPVTFLFFVFSQLLSVGLSVSALKKNFNFDDMMYKFFYPMMLVGIMLLDAVRNILSVFRLLWRLSFTIVSFLTALNFFIVELDTIDEEETFYFQHSLLATFIGDHFSISSREGTKFFHSPLFSLSDARMRLQKKILEEPYSKLYHSSRNVLKELKKVVEGVQLILLANCCVVFGVLSYISSLFVACFTHYNWQDFKHTVLIETSNFLDLMMGSAVLFVIGLSYLPYALLIPIKLLRFGSDKMEQSFFSDKDRQALLEHDTMKVSSSLTELSQDLGPDFREGLGSDRFVEDIFSDGPIYHEGCSIARESGVTLR